MSLTDEQLQKTIPAIIRQRRASILREETDKKLLIEYIQFFAEEKRGNIALLSKESGVAPPIISQLLSGTWNRASIERILTLAETVQRLLKK
ncbi:hypothetical protein [Leptospira santarosai]|uniref:hypothetical protein n=1 Tax=Leptospira santarosai TaxID=28183 RepID=UPI0024AECE32|nr:hypothetical protein [Leptospira santarosai]MDI7165930.1 hypothetical protein [Leptospira santarosai]